LIAYKERQLRSRIISEARPHHTQHDRSGITSGSSLVDPLGCSPPNSRRTYTINNSTFTIICNTTWDGSLYLNVMYTPNFTSCLQACVDWANETPCLGAQWDYSSPGYDGGHLCHLLWSMPSNNSTAATFKSEVDSAQLNSGPPPVHLLCFRVDRLGRQLP